MSPNELRNITDYLSNYKVGILKLSNTVLIYLPKQLFVRLPIKKFQISYSKIFRFESDDGLQMFKGLEKSLTEIAIFSSSKLSSWRLYTFSALKKLRILTISYSEWTKIEEVFPPLASLKIIHLESNQIKYLHKYTFTNILNLEELRISNNNIKIINRELLPNPATKLTIMDFSLNKIESIPDDFFINMPSLAGVHLENMIKFLSEKMFHPMILGQHFMLDLRDNYIVCCSNLTYLIDADYKYHIDAVCSHPHTLKGKRLHDLKLTDLKDANC